MDWNTSASIGPLPIEEQLLCLPSNGNVSAVHCELELSHRISLADHYLNGLWNLIAEKSFQFSHVICVSPRKGVTTRSRASVKKLNLDIAVHCHMYARCRPRLIALGADAATQSRLRVLTIGDVQASTAVINPNEPGSTKLKLSWIWQTAGGHRLGLTGDNGAGAGADTDARDPNADASLIECKSFSYLHFRVLNIRQFDVFIGYVQEHS
ncbi:hypothetical protein BYT27DRAFT_7079950 [Phlegmacium glaucopus]|nr:hypothetical protein BYT27DRAFT_7079950 [Phlegmacium glaucopus]